MSIAVKLLTSCYTTINQSLLKNWMVIHTRQYFIITYISQENWFNLIYSIFQDKSLPQAVKTVMDYLQLESQDWSLVYFLSCLPFHLLSFVVSCVFLYSKACTFTIITKVAKTSNCIFVNVNTFIIIIV
jgi:hypothetical protein